jgi:hypothetical protein
MPNRNYAPGSWDSSETVPDNAVQVDDVQFAGLQDGTLVLNPDLTIS